MVDEPTSTEAHLSVRTDEDLLAAYRAGDSDSLGVLVARWEQPLFRFAFRLLERREDARDVCQETFLRVLKKAHRFRQGARFSTWMYQIALNLCRDHLRRRRRWGLLLVESHGRDRDDGPPVEAPAGEDADPSRAVQQRQREHVVARALSALPPEQREVLVLKEFEGLKFREIAAILGCPESTVKSRMYYGLSGLRSSLERQGIHEPV